MDKTIKAISGQTCENNIRFNPIRYYTDVNSCPDGLSECDSQSHSVSRIVNTLLSKTVGFKNYRFYFKKSIVP